MPDNAPDPGESDPLSLHGVIPPTMIAFDEDERVDYETTAEQARFVADRGVHGVFPLGSGGEAPLLTGEERDRVIEAVVDEVGDEVPVIAGVGTPSTHETILRAKNAAAAGADGLVVVTPYYYTVDADRAVEHYRRVAGAVDLPIYLYHIPALAGNRLSVDAVSELAEIDNFAGLKDSSGRLAWSGKIQDRHPEISVLVGSDTLVYAGLEVGCPGVVSGISNVVPELVVDLYESFDAGDEDRAREIQSRIYDIGDVIAQDAYFGGLKAGIGARGVDIGPMRSPLETLDEEQAERVENGLRDLDVL